MYSGYDIRIETVDLNDSADEHRLRTITGEGWEPFAVVSGPEYKREIWFKRLVLAD